jgi:hypothetical protein
MRTSSLNVGNKMKDDKMGRARTTYGKEVEKCIQGYGIES